MDRITELFHRHRDDVYRLAVSYTRSPQEAEDVCQTVFLKLLENPGITPGKERAWLMQVTVNQCRSLLRSSWWKRTVPMDETLSTDPPRDNGVLQAVMALPPKYRVVVYLHYYECSTAAEIGKLLGISTSAVTTRLSRARGLLKARLKEE